MFPRTVTTAALMLLLLAGCDPEPKPKVTPDVGRTWELKEVNVAELCDAISAFIPGQSTDTRLIMVKAERSGIPDALERKAKSFGRAPSEETKRLTLLECASVGWARR